MAKEGEILKERMNNISILHQEEKYEEALKDLMELHAWVRTKFGPQSEEVSAIIYLILSIVL